jgi:hypothetical protein
MSCHLTKCDRLGVFDNKVLRKIAKGKFVFPTFGSGSIWQWTVFLMLWRNLLLPFSVQMRKPVGEKTLLCGEEQNRSGIMSELALKPLSRLQVGLLFIEIKWKAHKRKEVGTRG